MYSMKLKEILLVCSFFTTFFCENVKADPLKCYRFNNEMVPYGYYGQGHRKKINYGERLAVKSEEEALSLVLEFYSSMNVKVIPLRENRRFYKMEVRDLDDNILDIVIVDKFSGRIRSVY